MLEKRLSRLRNKEGVYIISPSGKPGVKDSSRVVKKVGQHTNLYNRLDSYHSCFPRSFYTYSCLFTRKGQSLYLEKLILDTLRQRKYTYMHHQYQPRVK